MSAEARVLQRELRRKAKPSKSSLMALLLQEALQDLNLPK